MRTLLKLRQRIVLAIYEEGYKIYESDIETFEDTDLAEIRMHLEAKIDDIFELVSCFIDDIRMIQPAALESQIKILTEFKEKELDVLLSIFSSILVAKQLRHTDYEENILNLLDRLKGHLIIFDEVIADLPKTLMCHQEA